jgi:hypothetical protein
VKEVVTYFGKLGFFGGSKGGDDDVDYLAKIADPYSMFPGTNIGFLPEQEFLRLDKCRIWCEDAEADFLEGDYWYVRTLLDWSRISRGCFQPQSLSEVWLPARPADPPHPDVKEQPIQVSFMLGDKRWSFEVLELGGWMDSSAIKKVNEAIHPTGYQFAYVFPPDGDQSTYLCCLTMAEVQKLKDERGWQFHEKFFCTDSLLD